MMNKSLTGTLLRAGVDGVGAHELAQLLSKAPPNMDFAAAGAWLAGLRVNREATLNAEARTAWWANPYIPNEYKRLLDAQEQGDVDEPISNVMANSSSRQVLTGDGKAIAIDDDPTWLNGPLFELEQRDFARVNDPRYPQKAVIAPRAACPEYKLDWDEDATN